jgi:hypothetical protein
MPLAMAPATALAMSVAGRNVRSMREPTDRQILELESRRYLFGGMKVAAITDELGLTHSTYYRRLGDIVERMPADVVADFGPLISQLRHRALVHPQRRYQWPA